MTHPNPNPSSFGWRLRHPRHNPVIRIEAKDNLIGRIPSTSLDYCPRHRYRVISVDQHLLIDKICYGESDMYVLFLTILFQII